MALIYHVVAGIFDNKKTPQSLKGMSIHMTREDHKDIKFYRKECLIRQTHLRKIMLDSDQHDEAMQLFFSQHAVLHSAKMAQLEQWSFEDAILNDITEEQIRRIPQNCEHSVAWNIWHIARIEDVTMNMLVAGGPQILNQSNWLGQMKISARDTGNVMNEEGVADLSETIDIAALREYRLTVGRRTRKIVKQLQPVDLISKVDPTQLQKVKKEGAVVDAASDLLEYWRKRNIAGLLLMPATRHNLVHLNEALQLKTRRQ
jgi:hypothetical protein